MNSERHARRLPWLLGVGLVLCAGSAAAGPATRAEVARALDLYDAKERVAAARLAEQLLREGEPTAEDRRLLVELAAAGRRDAYLEAAGGQADPSHLCAALAVLADYLAVAQADLQTARLRDEIEALRAKDPAAKCGVVEEAPRPVVAPGPPPQAALGPAPLVRAPEPEPVDVIPARHLRIAGGVMLGLGGGLLGAMIYGIVDQQRLLGQVGAIDEGAAGRKLWPEEAEQLRELRSMGVDRRNLAIGAGVAAAVLVGSGVALVVRGRQGDEKKRWSFAPMIGFKSAGFMLRFR